MLDLRCSRQPKKIENATNVIGLFKYAEGVGGELRIEKYDVYPIPIYELDGATKMDWRKVTKRDRDEAREKFRMLVRERMLPDR